MQIWGRRDADREDDVNFLGWKIGRTRYRKGARSPKAWYRYIRTHLNPPQILSAQGPQECVADCPVLSGQP